MLRSWEPSLLHSFPSFQDCLHCSLRSRRIKGGWPQQCHSGSRAESLPKSGDALVCLLLGFIHALSARPPLWPVWLKARVSSGILQPRHQSLNSSSYPHPCHTKPISDSHSSAFPPNSLVNARAPSTHRTPLAVCFLENTLLSADSSGHVAPSSSLDISQGLGWARFSSFGSWLSFAVPHHLCADSQICLPQPTPHT